VDKHLSTLRVSLPGQSYALLHRINLVGDAAEAVVSTGLFAAPRRKDKVTIPQVPHVLEHSTIRRCMLFLNRWPVSVVGIR